MPLYESIFIARQDMSTNDVDKLTASFSKIITDNGGKLCGTEYWGLRNLAYVIKKNRKGHYVMLAIDAHDAAMKEMERRMGLNENVIRNVTFKVDALPTKPTEMMNNDQEEAPRIQMQVLNNDVAIEEDLQK